MYLKAMVEDFRAAGGTVIAREFQSLQDVLRLPDPVVVNSSGLGSRDLFDDKEIFPIKGQLTVLKPQSDINYVIIGGGLYMMPRSDGILLGGTFERREESLEPNLDAAEQIFQGHKALFERMAGWAV